MRILLVGNIASGKTTLAKKLGRLLGVPVFKEDADRSRLFEAFSRQRAEWSFDFHMAMLNERFVNHFLCNLTGGVIDRTIWETMAFGEVARHLKEMTKGEYSRFQERFKCLEKHSAVRSAKIIFLDSSPERCLERLKLRGRGWERKIDLKYLQLIDKQYKKILKRYLGKHGKVKIVHTSERTEGETFRVIADYLGGLSK